MQNYYEMLGLDINVSLDEIKIKLQEAKQNNQFEESLLRQMSSILLNERLKQSYDEKLFDFILNQSSISHKKTMPSNELLNSISEKLDDNSGIDNKYIYAVLVLMAINMITIFLPITISNIASFVLGIVIMVLLIQDWNLLKQINKNTFSKWWSLFAPVYLFKRAKRLETKQTYFQIYMGLWIGFMLLFFVFIGSKAQLSSSACDVVTDIIHNQLRQSTSCKSVTIIESDGKYHSAIAELSNGKNLDINITETSSGDIYVEIER